VQRYTASFDSLQLRIKAMNNFLHALQSHPEEHLGSRSGSTAIGDQVRAVIQQHYERILTLMEDWSANVKVNCPNFSLRAWTT
jgi:hypothetical protein